MLGWLVLGAAAAVVLPGFAERLGAQLEPRAESS